MSRTHWLSSSQDDSRFHDNDIAKTLRYVSEEIEHVMRLLETTTLCVEPEVLQAAITQIVRGIGGIQAAITARSGLFGDSENNNCDSCEAMADVSDAFWERFASENNENFLRNLKNTIAQNLTDTELDVDRLSNLMNMSRRNLFRRIKSCTGLSPGELINEIRLRAAKELLLDGELKMYEIAEKTGFKSRIVFTRNFTRMYGTSPTQFLKGST